MHTKASRIYLFPGTAGLAVAASTAAGPGVSAVLPFKFPRRAFVTGILGVPRKNAAAAAIPVVAAGLSLTITDEKIDQMISDGRGTTIPATGGSFVPSGAGLLLLSGFGFRPFSLQRPVAQGDVWRLQLQNAVASIATMAGIYLFAEVDA